MANPADKYTIHEFHGWCLCYRDTNKTVSPIFKSLDMLSKYFYDNFYKKSRSKVMTPHRRKLVTDNIARMSVRKVYWRHRPRAKDLPIADLLKEGDEL